MRKHIRENTYDSCAFSIKITLFFLVIFIFFSISHSLAQPTDLEATIEQDLEATIEQDLEATIEQDNDVIEEMEKSKIEGSEEPMLEGDEKGIMEAQDETTMEIPEDEYHYNPLGKRDPFYSKLLVEKKKIEPNKKLLGVQRYELTELKLVGIIWGELGRKGVVETPEGKSYLIKVGTLIGKKDGVVKAITNNEVVIQEFVSDYLGNRIENISIMKIQRKEQEQ